MKIANRPRYGKGLTIPKSELAALSCLVVMSVTAGCAGPVQRHWDCPMSLNKISPDYVESLRAQVISNLKIPSDIPNDMFSIYGLRLSANGNLLKATLIGGSENTEFTRSIKDALGKSKFPPVPVISSYGGAEAAKIVISKTSTGKENISDVTASGEPHLEPITKHKPAYPTAALRQGIEGSVFAQVTVSTAGDVTDVTITNAEPPRIFDQTVKESIFKYKFRQYQNTLKVIQLYFFCIQDWAKPIPNPYHKTR